MLLSKSLLEQFQEFTQKYMCGLNSPNVEVYFFAVPAYCCLTFASWWYTDFDLEHWTCENEPVIPLKVLLSVTQISAFSQFIWPPFLLLVLFAHRLHHQTNVNITVLEKLEYIAPFTRLYSQDNARIRAMPISQISLSRFWRLWLCWHGKKRWTICVTEIKYAHFLHGCFESVTWRQWDAELNSVQPASI